MSRNMSTARIKRTTLYDVASRSGVSYQTVSRVINEHPNVSEETRQRVMDAIRELNYRPNKAAQSLVTRRSHTLAVITFGTIHYGPAQMVANVERAAKALGYNLTITSISDVSPKQIRRAIDSLSMRLVDGIVMITPILGAEYDELVPLFGGIPFVQIDTLREANTPSVVIDQYYGSQLATQHLIDLGHRHICEISGHLHWFGAVARHESWRATLENAGLSAGMSVEGDWTAASGYTATRRLLTQGAEFTAIVAGNDQMALGAIRALHEHGLRVPEDVSIVGFDDIPEAAYFEPPLTTVRQRFDVLGQQCVEYLVKLITQPDTPLQQHVLYPQFVERLSTRRIEV
jgi:DNA-binding LacI/PurR family transcriptional regulator